MNRANDARVVSTSAALLAQVVQSTLAPAVLRAVVDKLECAWRRFDGKVQAAGSNGVSRNSSYVSTRAFVQVSECFSWFCSYPHVVKS